MIPGEGNGNPLQYSCLGSPMDRGAGGLQSLGSQKVDTTERLNNNNTFKLVDFLIDSSRLLSVTWVSLIESVEGFNNKD